MNNNPVTSPGTPNVIGDLEVMAPSALEALERAQVDVQISTAHRFPRSLEKFKRRAMDMVQQDVETAESCIYSRPVGRGDDGKQKNAEGASIRMAEIVAACYGNIRVGARIIEQTERYVKAEGVAHDLESNYAAKSEAMESTVKKNGQPYDERMRIVVAKAALSKALRDAVFRVVPKALCKTVYDAAQQVIAGQSKTIEQRRNAVKQWLVSIRVDDARVFAALDVKGWSEIGEDQLMTLTGLRTAIKDNDVTTEEAFPHVVGKAPVSGVIPGFARSGPAKQHPAKAPAPVEQDDVPMTPSTEAVPQDEASALPFCKFCGEQVENMEAHSCPQMQTAIAGKSPAKAAKPEKAAVVADPEPTGADGLDEGKELLASIGVLLEQNEITLTQLLAFCQGNKLSKPGQKLSELAIGKLKSLNKAMQNNPEIIAEMKSLPEK